MNIDECRAQLYRERLVVIHRQRDGAVALLKARACREGGVGIQEITWTTPGAARAVRELRRLKAGVIGAGSILTARQAKDAVDAGAQFLVSPVFTKSVSAFAKRRKMLYLAGACSPQEIYDAWEEGVRPVKLFPSPDPCSPSYLKRLLGPMPFLELLPTGVGLEHLRPYLDAGAKAVGLGNPFTDPPEGNGADLAALAARAVEMARPGAVQAAKR
jgi:2-dehydro-3-deoxyphosphogluconate aldolase/(4S)-4-hydroxy-2-oxoglutarate aldolase